MRILIIEDNQLHIEAAQQQLGVEHELTICRSYGEAEKMLTGGGHWYKEDAEFPFDLVLTDLFLPPCPIGTESCVQHYETEEKVIIRDTPKAIKRFGAEIPYGLVFALVAMRRGVSVAILSDSSHHEHPINWALDMLENKQSFREMRWPTGGERVKDWESVLKQVINR